MSAVTCISVLVTLLVIAQTPPASGYEISIYDSYPPYFWVVVIIPFIISMISICINPSEKRSTPSTYQYITVIGTMVTLLLLLSLPFFRGYLLYTSGDVFAHIGYTKDIIESGAIGYNNLYPPLHILLYALLSFSGIDFTQITLFIPQIFVTVYVISIFILARSMRLTPLEALVTTFLAIVPVLGIEITREFVLPSFSAFCMIPLTLYVIFKSRSHLNARSYSLLMVILLMYFPFMHLEVAFFLLVCLISLYAGSHLIARIRNDGSEGDFIQGDYLLPSLILCIGFLLWVMSFVTFQKIIVRGIKQVFFDSGDSPSVLIEEMISTTHFGVIDSVLIITKSYGTILGFLLLATLLSSLVIIQFLLGREHDPRHLILAVLFVSFGVLLVVLFFKDWIFGISFRYAKFSVLIATLLIGPFITRHIARQRSGAWRGAFCVLMSFFIILAVLNLYPSPWINYSNRHISMAQSSGSDFFITHQDPSIPVIEMNTRFWNHKQAMFGMVKANLDPTYMEGLQISPPPHFGYNHFTSIGDLYERERYLAFTQLARLWYPTIYPDTPAVWKYTPTDFERLKSDPAVNSIFKSTNIEIYIIAPHRSEKI